METITREKAFELLKKYNKDPFHIQHGLTVEAVMRWYANELGYGDDADTDELAKLSGINEAASINADSDDIIYKIKSLFNSQL